jgi:hypothetical protein
MDATNRWNAAHTQLENAIQTSTEHPLLLRLVLMENLCGRSIKRKHYLATYYNQYINRNLPQV